MDQMVTCHGLSPSVLRTHSVGRCYSGMTVALQSRNATPAPRCPPQTTNVNTHSDEPKGTTPATETKTTALDVRHVPPSEPAPKAPGALVTRGSAIHRLLYIRDGCKIDVLVKVGDRARRGGVRVGG